MKKIIKGTSRFYGGRRAGKNFILKILKSAAIRSQNDFLRAIKIHTGRPYGSLKKIK